MLTVMAGVRIFTVEARVFARGPFRISGARGPIRVAVLADLHPTGRVRGGDQRATVALARYEAAGECVGLAVPGASQPVANIARHVGAHSFASPSRENRQNAFVPCPTFTANPTGFECARERRNAAGNPEYSTASARVSQGFG